eukprot:6213849-Pleurochrysis_carterae.AAC.1
MNSNVPAEYPKCGFSGSDMCSSCLAESDEDHLAGSESTGGDEEYVDDSEQMAARSNHSGSQSAFGASGKRFRDGSRAGADDSSQGHRSATSANYARKQCIKHAKRARALIVQPEIIRKHIIGVHKCKHQFEHVC